MAESILVVNLKGRLTASDLPRSVLERHFALQLAAVDRLTKLLRARDDKEKTNGR